LKLGYRDKIFLEKFGEESYWKMVTYETEKKMGVLMLRLNKLDIKIVGGYNWLMSLSSGSLRYSYL
jgi:hypothetical protein